MQKVFSLFLAFSLFANSAFGACDFSTGITKQDNGYLYNKECHILVGEIKQDLDIKIKQLDEYAKALALKDVAIDKANQRADLWMDTSFKVENRLNTIEDMRSTNNWMYFGLGVLTVLATGFIVAELQSHNH